MIKKGEEEATHRILILAEAVGIPAGIHIVHVSAKRAVPMFRYDF